MKRRLISGNLYNTVPKLVKLVSPLGIQQNYIIEKKYKFVDLLIVGGGGGGGTNSGSGGASGTIAFARNIKISLLPKTLTCKIAKPVNAQTDGDSTTLEINGDTIICAGGQRGNSEGAGGLANGSKIPDSIYTLHFDTIGRYNVILMHGAEAEIHASNYAVVFVKNAGGKVITHKDHTARVL